MKDGPQLEQAEGSISPPPARPVLSLALLAAVALLPYLGAVHGGFVYDDHILAEAGPGTGTGTWSTFMGSGLWGRLPAAGYYRPLVTLSFALDRWLGGGSPLPFHLTNLLLHLLLALTVWLTSLHLTGHRGVALGTAILFAVHPVHVEAVAWISGRGDLLAPLCGAGAWLCLLAGGWLPSRATRRTAASVPWLLLGAVLFFLALLAKESAVAFPLMAGCAALALRDPARPSTAARHPLAVPGAAAAALVLWSGLRVRSLGGFFGPFPADPLENPAAGLGLLDRLGTAARASATGWRLLIWPHPLRMDYSVPVLAPAPLTAPAGGGSALLLAGLAGLAFLLYRRSRRTAATTSAAPARHAGLGLGLLLLAWLPVSSLGPLPGSLLGERFLVLPSWGWALALAGGIRFLPPRPRLALLCLAVLTLGMLASRRSQVWRDDLTLLTEEVAREPVSYKVSYLRGLQKYAAGDDAGALYLFTASVQAAPTFSRAHEAMGRTQLRTGWIRKAVEAARHAIANEPPVPALRARYRVLLGEALAAEGHTSEALSILREAGALDPRSGTAARRTGDLLFGLHRLPEAEAAYLEAVRRDPLDPVPLFNLALTLAGQEKTAAAERAFARVLDLPDPPAEAAYHLGDLAEKDGRLREAARRYGLFLGLAPAGRDERLRREVERRLQRLQDHRLTGTAPDR
ncbi:MAG: tetratricopeptide repeat protein [Acidobacteriota bacterium]